MCLVVVDIVDNYTAVDFYLADNYTVVDFSPADTVDFVSTVDNYTTPVDNYMVVDFVLIADNYTTAVDLAVVDTVDYCCTDSQNGVVYYTATDNKDCNYTKDNDNFRRDGLI